jgi:hypothetical protein
MPAYAGAHVTIDPGLVEIVEELAGPPGQVPPDSGVDELTTVASLMELILRSV